LTTLPSLPSALRRLMCNDNRLTSLPSLSTVMDVLDCTNNNIILLPSLPEELRIVMCAGNPLELLPEFPLHLMFLSYNHLIDKSCQLYEGVFDPNVIRKANQKNRECMALIEQERCTTRCTTYKEQLMMKAWHPSRVEKLLNLGYDIEDM